MRISAVWLLKGAILSLNGVFPIGLYSSKWWKNTNPCMLLYQVAAYSRESPCRHSYNQHGLRHTPRWIGYRVSYKICSLKLKKLQEIVKKTFNKPCIILKHCSASSEEHKGRVCFEHGDRPYAARFSTSNPAWTWSPPRWMCPRLPQNICVILQGVELLAGLNLSLICYPALSCAVGQRRLSLLSEWIKCLFKRSRVLCFYI